MDVVQVLAVVRRFWALMLASALVGAGGGLLATVLATPRYDANVTLFFALNRSETVNELAQGTTYTQDLVQSFVQVARMPVVLQPVMDDIGLSGSTSSLASRVGVSAPTGTVLMVITVNDTSATRAAQTADAIAAEVSATVERLAPQSGEQTSAVAVTALAPAAVPSAPSSPRPVLNLGLGLLVGLALGGSVGLVLSLVRSPVASRQEVASLTEAPVLGIIPFDPDAEQRPVPTISHPQEARAEAFRSLRTNVRFLQASDQRQVLVVTSSTASEGKTQTAVNLAVSLSDVFDRVLLVDADLRRPTVASSLGIEGAVGLSTVLSGELELDDVVQTWGPTGLKVVAAGAIPPNPSELIGSDAMSKLIVDARSRYDAVIFDGAPVLPVTDSANLAARVDGALLVINGRRTSHRLVRECLTRLDIAGATTVGVILNSVKVTHEQSYYRREGTGRRLVPQLRRD